MARLPGITVLGGMTNGNIDMAVTFILEQYMCVTCKALKGDIKNAVVQERSGVITWDGMSNRFYKI